MIKKNPVIYNLKFSNLMSFKIIELAIMIISTKQKIENLGFFNILKKIPFQPKKG